MKKTVGLVGYFGWGNFGDELFLRTHRQYLSADFELKVIHDLLQVPYFSRPIEDVVRDYDAFIIGGGDLINPMRLSELYWQMAYLSKPTFIFGVGVPASKHSRPDAVKAYRTFFQHPNCKLVIARDPESMKWIADVIKPNCRIEWYPDPVCAMSRPAAVAPKAKTLGVVLRSHRSMSEDLSSVRRLIDYAKSLDYSVKHLVLGTGQTGEADKVVARTLARDEEEVIHSEDLNELCLAISSCSMLATIKFHGMVVATMYGIPSIAMSVTPKNRNFLRQIDRGEMLGGYTGPDTWRKLSYEPARIHQMVRAKLFRDARRSYAVLKEELLQNV